MKLILKVLAVFFAAMIAGCFGGNEVLERENNASYLKKSINVYNQVFFRGTPNNWGVTLMNKSAENDNLWVTYVEFEGNVNDRFKVDVSIGADWAEAYPAEDCYITKGAGIYKIEFDQITKEVTATKGGAKENVTIKAFVKEGDTFNLVGKKISIYAEQGNGYYYIDEAELKNVNNKVSADFEVYPGKYRISIYALSSDFKWKYVEDKIIGVLENQNNEILFEIEEELNAPNVKCYPNLEGYTAGTTYMSSPLIGADYNLYRNGIFYKKGKIQSFYIYHGMSGAIIELYEKNQGSYKIEIDSKLVSEGKTYQINGITEFEITEKGQNINPSLTITAEELDENYVQVKYSVYTNAGFGNAVYITGAGEELGNWVAAKKMTYNSDKNVWEIALNLIEGTEFKIVKGQWQDTDTIPTSAVIWEKGNNREVVKLYNGIIYENINPIF